MENTEQRKKGRVGRPKKEVKQDQLLAVMCSKAERFTHSSKAVPCQILQEKPLFL